MRLSSAAVAAALTFCSAAPLYAWEPDVHYGLTRWLATQAGFPRGEAATIASGDQNVDESIVTDPVGNAVLACVINEEFARPVHQHHFPSQAGIGVDADLRVVTPGKLFYGGNILLPPAITGSRSPSLFDLGRYLHALQDTWSHQGRPDFPDPPCGRAIGWGHPRDRGGWNCHLADLSYRWPKDVNEMAKASYDILVSISPGAPKLWQDLVPHIEEFSRARSKWDKDAWFRSAGNFDDEELAFLQETSLPDCTTRTDCKTYPFRRRLETTWRSLAKQNDAVRQQRDTPGDVENAIQSVLNWMVIWKDRQLAKIPAAIDQVSSRAALYRALRVDNSCPLPTALERILFLGGLSSGRVGLPVEFCEAAMRAAVSGAKENSCEMALKALEAVEQQPLEQHGPDLQDVIPEAEKLGVPLYLVSVRPDPASEGYRAVARFIHLPRDVLILTVRRVQGEAKVIDAFWSPDL
jgi:hypothetical protein